jgi:hypothetical protein
MDNMTEMDGGRQKRITKKSTNNFFVDDNNIISDTDTKYDMYQGEIASIERPDISYIGFMSSSIFSDKMSRYKKEEEYIEPTHIEDNKTPICLKLSAPKINIEKLSLSPIFRDDVNYPKFSLGFHHWIHASKSKSYKFDAFKGKKKVYNVVNGYECNIDDYDKNISDNKLFETSIICQDFYALWEVIFCYDLINPSNKSFKSLSITQNYGFSSQTIMTFRKLYCDNKNDEYHVYNENIENSHENENEDEKEFDKTNPKNIELNKKNIKDIDLIVSECGKQWNLENIQEQQSAFMIYEQIIRKS